MFGNILQSELHFYLGNPCYHLTETFIMWITQVKLNFDWKTTKSTYEIAFKSGPPINRIKYFLKSTF